MKKLLLALLCAATCAFTPRTLFAEWDFDPKCLDILVVYNETRQRWDPVPGPYLVMNGRYSIPILADKVHARFRVAREWGTPFVVAP